jgi:hypothetical protein
MAIGQPDVEQHGGSAFQTAVSGPRRRRELGQGACQMPGIAGDQRLISAAPCAGMRPCSLTYPEAIDRASS